ncbi:MAG: carbohydrate kinase family protein [Chloroflexota bacterium]|nr:MAG: carbohydrate kinase family protein [Chloroflexota bacterium]
MAQYEVVVAGHLCLDILPGLARGVSFTPGRSVAAGPATLATGGAVANTGVALHRLGVPALLVGRVGDDLFGQAVRQIIGSRGPELTAGLVVAPGEQTSHTIVLSPPDADRMFIHHPGCNAAFTAADVTDEMLAQARLLHFGYPPTMARMSAEGGRELATLMRRAKLVGAGTSLDWTMIDPHGPAGLVDWREVLAAALPHVDLFMPNIEELLLALDRPTFERMAAAPGGLVEAVTAELLASVAGELIALGAGVVGLKIGHRGMYLRTAGAERLSRMARAAPADRLAWSDRELWAPCFAVEVAGTTGAGDATIAGFLMGLLRGFGPEDALIAANAVGACSVEAADAVSGVRSWPETAERIAAGWPRRGLEPGSLGWRWDAGRQLWRGPNDGGGM